MESILIFQEFDVCHQTQTNLINRDQPSSQVFNKFGKILRGSGDVPGWRQKLWGLFCQRQLSLLRGLADHSVQTFAVVPTAEERRRVSLPSLKVLRSVRRPRTSGQSSRALRTRWPRMLRDWWPTRRGVYKASWGEQFWLAIRSYPRSCWASSSATNTRSRSWISLKT